MEEKNQPLTLKGHAGLLRNLPQVIPPSDLHQSIMRSLPGRRGLPGRLEYALKRSMSPNACLGSTRLLPSKPVEYGITTIITGCFLLFLGLSFVVAVHRTGLEDAFFNALFALAPVLLGSILLAMAGWVQVRSPRLIVRQHSRFAATSFLFILSAIIGYLAGGQHITNMTACLLGLSGLIITLGLALIPMFSMPPREVYCDEKSFVV